MKGFIRPICIGIISAMFLPYAVKSSVDYCKFHRDHLLCDPKKVDEACGDDHKVIPVTDEMKNIIVKAHNEARSEVATGTAVGAGNQRFLEASDMREISWNNLLALAAQRMTNRCALDSHSLNEQRMFPVVGIGMLGENFYQVRSNREPKLNWKDVIYEYDREKAYYNIGNVHSFQPDRVQPGTEGQTGHFTQIVWAKTYLIGCASTGFKTDTGFHAVIAACLYGPVGNVETEPVYLQGPHCTDCPNGGPCSLTYPGLCSSKNLPRPKPSDFPAAFDSYASAPQTKQEFWYLIVAFGSVAFLA